MLEIREVQPLQVREKVVAHLVFRLTRRIEEQVPRDTPEYGVGRAESDGGEREEHDRLERGALLERIDDRADEARRHDPCQSGRRGAQDADH